MYKIKQVPEDFKVKEIIKIDVKEKGSYCYFLLKKKNYTTVKAIEQIANVFGKRFKDFGFAGTKDKKAVTEQMVSAKGISKARIEKIDLKDIEIEFKGYGDEPISLGDLEGNEFEIVVRNIENKPEIKKRFVNYFGEQRFSVNNAETGKAIIKKDFKKAVELILENEGDYEKDVEEYLESNENDYVGALRKIKLKILKMFVHAYQSRLWNDAVKDNLDKEEIPIIGFGTDSDLYEGINQRDFIIKQIPELSSEGGIRKVYAEAKDLVAGELEKDELNQGKKIKLKFKLDKGCYATEFIKQNF